MLRVRGVRPVAVPLECRLRGVERLGGKAQVAGDECNLGFGNDAPRTSHLLFRSKSARRPSQQSLRSNEIAELGHRNAAKRKSRRIVAQSDPLQRAEGVARCQCTRCSSDQRVHRNRAKLVTPIISTSGVRSECNRQHGTEKRICLTFCIRSESNRRRQTMSTRHWPPSKAFLAGGQATRGAKARSAALSNSALVTAAST